MQDILWLKILKHFNLSSRINFWNVNGFDFPLFFFLSFPYCLVFSTLKCKIKVDKNRRLHCTDLHRPQIIHPYITCAYKIKTLNEESNTAYFYLCSRMKLAELKKSQYIWFTWLLLMVTSKTSDIRYCMSYGLLTLWCEEILYKEIAMSQWINQ